MKWLIVTCVLLSSGHIWDSFGLEVTAQENTKMLPSLSTSSVIEKTSSEDAIINESEKISPKIVEESPARQGPQAPGWGGLLSGKKIVFIRLFFFLFKNVFPRFFLSKFSDRSWVLVLKKKKKKSFSEVSQSVTYCGTVCGPVRRGVAIVRWSRWSPPH